LCSGRLVPGPKLGQLAGSTTCEIEHIEKEDESLVLGESVAKCELMARCGRQVELGRLITN
jgi:hypothetical protein